MFLSFNMIHLLSTDQPGYHAPPPPTPIHRPPPPKRCWGPSAPCGTFQSTAVPLKSPARPPPPTLTASSSCDFPMLVETDSIIRYSDTKITTKKVATHTTMYFFMATDARARFCVHLEIRKLAAPKNLQSENSARCWRTVFRKFGMPIPIVIVVAKDIF